MKHLRNIAPRQIRNSQLAIALLVGMGLAMSSCKKEEDPPVEEEPGFKVEQDEQYSGGRLNTVFDVSENAFAFKPPALGSRDELLFFVGNSFFNQNWVSSPSSTTARDGLGPTFNARTCSGCHFKDGRGAPPSFTGEISTGFLLRLSVPGTDAHGGPLADPNYGGQLQDQSLPGVPKEGDFEIIYSEVPGTFPDGETYSLRKPTYVISGLNYGSLGAGYQVSPRIGQQMIGLGLLEAIDEATLIEWADESDSDGDGVSGRINYVWDETKKQISVGRFGWKSNQPNLKQQTAGAFNGDMGITTSLFPDQNCPSPQKDCQQAPHGGEPEITDDDLDKVVLYVSNLAVPARRDYAKEQVLQGREIFKNIGCASCHKPKVTTGTHPVFDHLSNQTIRPYTDLLLHDMGPELADNRPDYGASGSEWRTQPLWGIGLIESVNHHTLFLHDGRARNVQEAILWHGGEAEAIREKFKNLSAAQRQALIAFVNSL
ncbi:c-type cytochrome [bacterium SCSIO 12741]|nr:c-type cytochrome [bacterium SCSIO 12741]